MKKLHTKVADRRMSYGLPRGTSLVRPRITRTPGTLPGMISHGTGRTMVRN